MGQKAIDPKAKSVLLKQVKDGLKNGGLSVMYGHDPVEPAPQAPAPTPIP